MAVRYKKFGKQDYAYRIWNEKDSKTGKWIQKSEYLGVVEDKENKVYIKKNIINKQNQAQTHKENAILDYGDTYFLCKLLKKDALYPILQDILKDNIDTLVSLMFYRMQGGLAMRYAQNWYDGNIACKFFPKAKVTTQSISEFMKYLGEEKLQQKFFRKYIESMCQGKSGLIIDSTGLPNEIQLPMTEWGYHNGGIEKETRLILAVDKEEKLPLYFRYVAGNIGDVSTLTTTIMEIKQLGVIPNLSIIDAGYYSETNIKALYQGEISFLTRMPSSRIIYKELIAKNQDIQNGKNIVKYNDRALFVKEEKIKLYGNNAYAYIVCDSERRGREISKNAANYEEEPETFDISSCGMMVLVSNMQINKNEVIPLYYTRQAAEQLFGISKDDLNILPLRIHTEQTFRGFMFLIFLSLIVYTKIKRVLGNENTLEQALSLMKNLKCKIYEGNEPIISEVNKKQRQLFEKCDVLVPKNLGV